VLVTLLRRSFGPLILVGLSFEFEPVGEPPQHLSPLYAARFLLSPKTTSLYSFFSLLKGWLRRSIGAPFSNGLRLNLPFDPSLFVSLTLIVVIAHAGVSFRLLQDSPPCQFQVSLLLLHCKLSSVPFSLIS